ncbi:hypothetical protein CPK_ORF00618 [Chlamydia pneumoniae LPCoLN]|nr:hypothetical protein CPK_ORF00618 [Chlamydia pneumoniae LPCoLN]ETR79992.1 hypothetical protein X556_0671 [Chlamydia pneumoniae B21]
MIFNGYLISLKTLGRHCLNLVKKTDSPRQEGMSSILK